MSEEEKQLDSKLLQQALDSMQDSETNMFNQCSFCYQKLTGENVCYKNGNMYNYCKLCNEKSQMLDTGHLANRLTTLEERFDPWDRKMTELSALVRHLEGCFNRLDDRFQVLGEEMEEKMTALRDFVCASDSESEEDEKELSQNKFTKK